MLYTARKYSVQITNLNRTYYRKQGYPVRNEQDILEVLPEHLPETSRTDVLCSCDYCTEDFMIEFRKRNRRITRGWEKDCCNKTSCIKKFREENRYNDLKNEKNNFDEDEKKIVSLYKDSHLKKNEIVNLFWGKYSLYQVNQVLKHGNHKTNDDYRNMYSYDKLFFKRVNSRIQAYFLGFIYADGSVSGKTFKWNIKSEDAYIIEAFKKAISYNGNLESYNDGNQIQIRIYSEELVKQLENLGVRPNKTYDLDFPTQNQVSKCYLSHFIRGFLDGDGYNSAQQYITKKGRTTTRYRYGFSGHKNMIEPISKHLMDIEDNGDFSYVYPNKNLKKMWRWVFTISNKRLYENHMRYIYKDSENFDVKGESLPLRLERKYNAWKAYMTENNSKME